MSTDMSPQNHRLPEQAHTHQIHGVCVLLATYNGAQWLDEQLTSIRTQQGGLVRIVARDDASSDNTPSILRHLAQSCSQLQLLLGNERTGSAGRNFYRLIDLADIGDATHVAFSDQDDLWMPDKLQRAISELQQTGADAYSSNFLAWYPTHPPSRPKILVNKAQSQKRWDHLFQGPGPGCTFVLTRQYFLEFRDFLRRHRQAIDNIHHHDWLIYAHARSQNRVWHIDPQATLLYRQHEHNEMGVSLGWSALGKRMSLIQQGWLRDECLKIASLLGYDQVDIVQRLARLSILDRLVLSTKVGQLRRKQTDQLKLALAFLFLMH